MSTDNQADRLEEAKKLMEWERYDDPTLLEYLRYYKSGSIGEVHIEAAITTKIAEERKSKDNAYWERNQLVAFLASQYEAHMVRHPDSDKSWEDDWRWIVCIHTPKGQLTWHIHDTDVQTFGWLSVEPDAEHWDGHSTPEKYARVSDLATTHRNAKSSLANPPKEAELEAGLKD